MFLLQKSYWEVKPVGKKGRGVFVTKDIAVDTVIGDYLGILMREKDFHEETYGTYDMYFNSTTSIVASPKKVGVHLINHSCAANCTIVFYHGHALYVALRHIFAGEELTVQYSLDPPEKNHICIHACHCGSPLCFGTMHTSFMVQKDIATYLKKCGEDTYNTTIPVPLGSQLPPLDSYPHSYDTNDPIFDIFGNEKMQPVICTESILPSLQMIREKIRKTGRMLFYPKINVYIYGIINGLILLQGKNPLTRGLPEAH